MAKHGGYRPGAGKKVGTKASHTVDAIEMRKKVIATVEKNLAPLMEAKLDLALGHYEEKADADGTVRVYKKAPDGNAIQYLLNQGIGKPKENAGEPMDVRLQVDF